MAESSTVARPYAQAAFELARDTGALSGWSEMLTFLAAVAQDPTMQAMFGTPELSDEQLGGLVIDIAGEHLDELGKNFVRVLAGNDRLALLPEIAEQFEEMRAEAEGTVEAEVVSAYELSDAQKQQLAQGLKKRFGREVKLVTRVDEGLIGGAVIRAGDLVIDGSAAEQLNRLANVLAH